MDTKITDYFTDIVKIAEVNFQQVNYTIDTTPKRSILRLEGQYGEYRILITELFSDELRKYRYYVLRGDWVEAGFDNSPDPRAIRLKYGRIGKQYANEYIPHLHQDDKNQLFLTEEMTFVDFVDWVKTNLDISL
ncbi:MULTISPECIES: hypothetical protein [unclassified Anabaena]|uniref:hypothetical protein n=1 Tax=unclassified Anabaena TaxID=2619674 RepID=UPI001447626C|nr:MULTISPECIES: hypothetical protein [unclassified Anabaena]MTJ08251.1 hypothetical protein [Anabaena sp. UHCC 0204]MTJ53475.1 hypothetical protein [Anabaena sp. UHCC 0253]